MSIQQGDIFRGNLFWIMAGQSCLTTFHFRCASAASAGTAINALLNGAMNRMEAFAAFMANSQHASILYERVQIHTLHGRMAFYERDKQLEIAGQSGGDLLPGFVGCPLYLRTDYAGRSRRGRLHVGGFTETDQSGGVLSSEGITKMGAIRTYYENTFLPGSTMEAIIFSRKIWDTASQVIPWWEREEGVAGSHWAKIRSATYSPVLGTVYTRKVGRGA